MCPVLNPPTPFHSLLRFQIPTPILPPFTYQPFLLLIYPQPPSIPLNVNGEDSPPPFLPLTQIPYSIIPLNEGLLQ